ncbi:MAG: T9SS type A sorting domain-containing protein, partial [Bacteroidales bacterium]|nr:T9SS type A sorting domain-containing protein [Bacteroidales bacterium]
KCSLENAEIYYTTNNSDPTTNTTTHATAQPHHSTVGQGADAKTLTDYYYILIPHVSAGTTVKAIAHKTNMTASEIAYAVYADGNSVSGGVVLLDDREDHSWSYYSMGGTDNPVHSLNPADVKISYFGYGDNTMTTTDTKDVPTTFDGDVDEDDVAVGPNDPGNQFIYLKTLENANEDGTGNYPYTMIPNPFSKRPTYENSGSAPTTRTIYLVTTGNNNGRGTLTVTYTNANGQSATETVNINSNNFSDTRSITAKVGGTITYSLQRTAGTVRSGAYYDTSDGTEIWYVTRNSNGTSTPTNPYTVQASASSDTKYRGFYAWRVKSLSSGLTIQSKDGNTTYGVSAIIPAETEIEFVTTNAEGNEVEFEALWAKAYVVTSNTATGLHAGVSYERNFVVGTTVARVGVPATYSSRYPDGISAGTASVNGFDCNADAKFEYMTISGGTFIANNNNRLIFGRGLTGTASTVTGTNATGNISGGLQYGIRLESGTISDLGLIRTYNTSGTANVNGRVHAKIVLGSDYDRANKINNELTCTGRIFFGRLIYFNSIENKEQEIMNLVIKSGTFQEPYWTQGWEYSRSIYCGNNFNSETNVSGHYPGVRNVIVEGGELGNLNGGRGSSTLENQEGLNQTNINITSFNLRVKGGTFHGAVFGGASNTSSWGSKKLVLTGGKVYGWIAGGANGTNTNAHTSITTGNSYIYVGGNTEVGGSNAVTINGTNGGQVYGAGRGSTNQACSMDNSNVVIADNAKIKNNNNNTGNVYGGGNIGYITNTAKVYILGGLVEGNVYGGAFGNANVTDGGNTYNHAIPTSKVYVKGGTVNGSVYGGSNSTGNVGNVTMEITGGEIKGSVFGGGLGQPTNVTGDVTLTVGKANSTDTATIGGDVYGGSEKGKVNTNTTNKTEVTINQGNILGNVYGGGLGVLSLLNSGEKDIPNCIAADVNGNVTVEINGGNLNKVFGCNNQYGAPQGTVTVNFKGGEAVDVYGGGNLADYSNTAGPVVNIEGGKITNAVYGGGSLAKVYKTLVNISDGEANNVFAGAEGNKATETLVDHIKTLNMTGGSATALYGGSYTCLDKEYSFVNISGGRVKTHVFGSGYFGNMEGSCFVYIGKNAIENAPNHGLNTNKMSDPSTETPIWIENNVYAGANWGSFEGTFGDPTIIKTGNTGGISNIYIDGTDYNMEHGKTGNYMIIGGSVFGSGTSCAAGSEENNIIIREYGKMYYPSMSRSLKSIQQATELVLDHSSIDFLGQGNIKSLDPTEEFGICNIGTIYATNTTNMALSKPMDMVKKLSSSTCTNTNGVYADAPTYDETGYGAATNGIVINNGGYLMVRYENENEVTLYGELEGYFYMREPGDDAGINNEGYIFARPKLIPNNGESDIEKANTQYNVFVEDGGFVDFNIPATKNIYDANGNNVNNNNNNNSTPVSPINTLDDPTDPAPATGVQMAYTNRTTTPGGNRTTDADNGTDYRFWRYEPETFPVSTREIVFVVKASDQASSTSEKFLTTTGSVQLPPSIGTKYYITGLTWGADGKDCNPAPYTATSAQSTTNPEVGTDWQYYDAEPEGTDLVENDYFPTSTTPDKSEYYANPNSTFGFLMTLKGNLTGSDPRILSDDSWASHFMAYANPLALVNTSDQTNLPELEFLVTYSDRLSQNELWSEARMTIDEVEEIEDEVTHEITRTIKQRIYLNLSVTTMTKFGQNVETYVYASVVGDAVDSYTAQLTLPTFTLDRTGSNSNVFNAEFKMNSKEISEDFDTHIDIVNWNNVENNATGKANLAMHVRASANDDKSQGWTGHMGYPDAPNQAMDFDFNSIQGGEVLGAADGRKFTTIQFELRYDPRDLEPLFNAGQKYLGDLIINMNATPIAGGANTFKIIVHVYVTGATKFYYLDGVAGKDGNSGMFPDQAKKTLNGVLNSSGYTINDPIFVVNGVDAKNNRTLTWDANRFAEKGQVKVYRYPGSHNKENGDTNSVENGFYNGMYTGRIVTIPEGAQFNMHNVCISGGKDLDNNIDYNPMSGRTSDPNEEGYSALYPNGGNPVTSDFPLICIAEGAEVSIDNSSLVNNNNTCTTAVTVDNEINMNIYYAGAISNYGTLTIDGVTIKDNKSKGTVTGIYQNGIMNLGSSDTITISDQIFLTDDHWMDAVTTLNDESRITDIMVEIANNTVDVPDDPTPSDVNVSNSITRYSGRLIVRYKDIVPKAPAFGSYLPNNQKVFGSIRKAAPAYESQKYALDDELTKTGRDFKIANGADPEVLPYITSEMRAQYDPTNHDLIMANINANLPVELLYFTAECMGEATQLQWSTASETNNEYFTIERSSDAVNYEEVARIQGAGTTSQRNDYSFMVDNNSTAITYYRLRQTDIDGKYEIFTPIAIQCQNEKTATEISIYPVPANDQVNIFSSNSPMTRIEIYSIMGAKVAEEQAEGNQATLHIGNLARGVYAVKVFTEDGQVSNARLIKK